MRRRKKDFRLGPVSVWSLHVLPMPVWVFSGATGFLPPPPKDMLMRRINVSPLSCSECVWVSVRGPAMKGGLSRVGSHLAPWAAGTGSSHCDPELEQAGWKSWCFLSLLIFLKWMHGSRFFQCLLLEVLGSVFRSLVVFLWPEICRRQELHACFY